MVINHNETLKTSVTRPLRVLIDARQLYSSGIGRYIRNTLRGFLEYSPLSTVTLASDTRLVRRFLAENQDLSARVSALRYNAPIYSFKEQVNGGMLFNKYASHFDVLHFPHYNVPLVLPRNSIVTIHDANQLLYFPNVDLLRKQVMKALYKKALKCKTVMTVSHTSRETLVDLFRTDKDKIRVIYNLISNEFSHVEESGIEAFKREKGLGNYLLYVGNLKPHKNLGVLVTGCSSLLNDGLVDQLVIITSSTSEVTTVQNVVANLGLHDKVRILTGIPDVDLVKFYNSASVLILPSLMEGFGYPPLEALACGTKVVVSDIPVFHETLGSYGLYFDPSSSKALDIKLREALASDFKFGEAAAAVRRRFMNRFDIGQQVYEAYLSVCNK